MTRYVSASTGVELSGLDGTNPLGFLAALGTLATLHGTGERAARLSWKRRLTWRPVIEGVSKMGPIEFSEIVARGLQGRTVREEAQVQRAQAAEHLGAAKKALNEKRKEIRDRKLKGAARKAALAAEVEPLERNYESVRRLWLETLAAAVPRAELALGNRLDCTSEEYRQHAAAFVADSNAQDRDALDLLAAFGSDACLTKNGNAVAPTPFQFITGSGHQFFLRTVRELMEKVTPDRVRNTLFDSWTYSDEGLSMRWDPIEDRRYALMDRDPTASGNKPRTMWMANLLGYRALTLFTSAPRRRGPAVISWALHEGELSFTWPLWEFAVLPSTAHSLLALAELRAPRPDCANLRERGVAAVFRARRIKVGMGANYKLNFTPARAV